MKKHKKTKLDLTPSHHSQTPEKARGREHASQSRSRYPLEASQSMIPIQPEFPTPSATPQQIEAFREGMLGLFGTLPASSGAPLGPKDPQGPPVGLSLAGLPSVPSVPSELALYSAPPPVPTSVPVPLPVLVHFALTLVPTAPEKKAQPILLSDSEQNSSRLRPHSDPTRAQSSGNPFNSYTLPLPRSRVQEIHNIFGADSDNYIFDEGDKFAPCYAEYNWYEEQQYASGLNSSGLVSPPGLVTEENASFMIDLQLSTMETNVLRGPSTRPNSNGTSVALQRGLTGAWANHVLNLQ